MPPSIQDTSLGQPLILRTWTKTFLSINKTLIRGLFFVTQIPRLPFLSAPTPPRKSTFPSLTHKTLLRRPFYSRLHLSINLIKPLSEPPPVLLTIFHPATNTFRRLPFSPATHKAPLNIPFHFLLTIPPLFSNNSFFSRLLLHASHKTWLSPFLLTPLTMPAHCPSNNPFLIHLLSILNMQLLIHRTL